MLGTKAASGGRAIDTRALLVRTTAGISRVGAGCLLHAAQGVAVSMRLAGNAIHQEELADACLAHGRALHRARGAGRCHTVGAYAYVCCHTHTHTHTHTKKYRQSYRRRYVQL